MKVDTIQCLYILSMNHKNQGKIEGGYKYFLTPLVNQLVSVKKAILMLLWITSIFCMKNLGLDRNSR